MVIRHITLSDALYTVADLQEGLDSLQASKKELRDLGDNAMGLEKALEQILKICGEDTRCDFTSIATLAQEALKL